MARVVQHVGAGLDWGWGRGLGGLTAAAAGGLGRLLPGPWRTTAGRVVPGQGQFSAWEVMGPAQQQQQQQQGQGQAAVRPIALGRRRRRGREFVMRKALRPLGRRAGGGGGGQVEEWRAAGAAEGPGSRADGRGSDNSREAHITPHPEVGAGAEAGLGGGLRAGVEAEAEAGVARRAGPRVYDWGR